MRNLMVIDGVGVARQRAPIGNCLVPGGSLRRELATLEVRMVVSSGATKPYLAENSIAMLQIVSRPSIGIERIAGPANSTA